MLMKNCQIIISNTLFLNSIDDWKAYLTYLESYFHLIESNESNEKSEKDEKDEKDENGKR